MAKSKSELKKLSEAKKVQQTEEHLPEKGARPSGPEGKLLHLQQVAGNRAISQLLTFGADRASSDPRAVSQPGDVHEQEADRVAGEVMQRSDETNPNAKRGKASNQTSASDGGSQLQDFSGRGQPLSESERAFFEARFGRDFSDVRVQNDAQAAEMAETLNARAFTIGRDIVFGAGEHAPQTEGGKKLIAHELTHVAQQESTAPGDAPAPTVMRKPKRRELELGESATLRPGLQLSGSKIPEPIVTRVGAGVAAIVYFGQNSFLLNSTNLKAVEKLSEDLRFIVEPTISVDGHASTEGNEEDNQKLSESRRQAVIALLSAGLKDKNIKFTGKAYGESMPAIEETRKSGETELEEQRAQNRRVEIVIIPSSGLGLGKPIPHKKPTGIFRPEISLKPDMSDEELSRLITDPRLRRIAEELQKKGSLSDLDVEKAADRALEQGIGVESRVGREVIKGLLRSLIEQRKPGFKTPKIKF